MRDAASKPDASIRLLADLADNTDAQTNLRSLLGNAEADDIIRKAVAAKEVAKRIGALEQGARSGLGAAPTERDLSDIAPDVIVKSGPMGNKVELFDNFFQSVSRLLTAKGLSSAEALQVSRDLLDPEKVDLVRDQLAKQIGEGPADAARRRAQAFYGPMAERLGIAATRAAVTQREPPPKTEAPAAPPAENPAPLPAAKPAPLPVSVEGERISPQVPPAVVQVASALSPTQLKALAIVLEASPNRDEMRAVGHVLNNRARNPKRYGESLNAMLLGGEFDGFKTTSEKINEMLTSDRFREAEQIVTEIDAGKDPDPTAGATHFLAPRLMQQKGYTTPSWAKRAGQPIGETVFYSGVD
jgi:hypothetical protein